MALIIIKTLIGFIVGCIVGHFVRKYFISKCHHEFDPVQVHDLNQDPVCQRCKIYYSKLAEKRKYQFVWNEKQQHYNIKRA